MNSNSELTRTRDELRVLNEQLEARVTGSTAALTAAIEERKRAEALATAILQTAMDGFWLVGEDKRILEVNDAYCRLSGYSRDELLAMRVDDIEDAEAPDEISSHVHRITEAGWDRFETRHRRKDGTTAEIEVSVNYLRQDGRFVVFLRGITERKQAQQALEASEARFRAVVASAPAAIVVAQAGKIVLWNQGAERLFQYSQQEAMDQPVTMLIPEPYLTRHREAVQRLHASGEERLAPKSYEAHALRKDGSQCPVQVSLAVWQSAQGAFASAIITDITKRKRAEQALGAAEERYRTLFERNLAGVYRSTRDGRIVECNEAFARIYGYGSREEILRHSAVDLYPDAEARTVFIDRLKRERTLLSLESQGRRKDGSPVWILETASLVDCEDGNSCNEGTIIDITERKRLEEQLVLAQKMEAIGQLAGGVAHDFNNILGVITGYGELAQRQLGPKHPVRPRVDQMVKAAERAAGLTRQLLAFSRKQIMQPRLLDLNALVADTHKMLGRLIDEDVTVVVHAAPGLGTVKADPGQIEQIILNLAVNARDAMPKGGTLTLETANADLDGEYAAAHPPVKPGRYVMLAVSDTGIGMDKETQLRIFEPFFTTKPEGEGTGLGLATVYGVVKQSGGYIWVYSEPDRGTTFKVYLPRFDEPVETERAGAPLAEAPRGHETILLAEDTETLRDVVREMLEQQGYTVLPASGGEEALDLAREHTGPIHLLLTDVVMPKLGGGDLAKQVAALRPGIRVLYMSGYTDGAVSRQGVLGEGLALLQKPFTKDKLARAVREALRVPGAERAVVPAEARVLVVEDDAQVRDLIVHVLGNAGYQAEPAGTVATAIEALGSGREYVAVLCDLALPDGSGEAVVRRLRETRPELGDRVLVLTGDAVEEVSRKVFAGRETLVLGKPISFARLLGLLGGLAPAPADPAEPSPGAG